MRTYLIGALLVGSLGMPLRAAVPSDAYFPLEKGFSWVYDTLDKKENKHFDMKVVIEGTWEEKATSLEKMKHKQSGMIQEDTKSNAQDDISRHGMRHRDLGGAISGMIMTQKDKRGTMREFLIQENKGIFIYKLGLSKGYTPEVTTKFIPPVPRVIYPLEPGTKVHWEGRLKVAWVDKKIVFDGEVIGFEDIEVPAGKFHCIKLHYHETRGNDVVDETAWYAQGVGQVKYDGGQYVKELKSYSPSK